MILDARAVPAGTVIDTDVCIIGGGAAGITIAREFINSGLRVTLLESGADELEQATQDLYTGRDIGRPYDSFPNSRYRHFGGTTNHWGAAWCDLPSPFDFEAHEGFPYSGWPFPLSHLEPWYRRAQPVLRLGPYGYAPADWGIMPGDIPKPFDGPHFVCRVLQQTPTMRFGDQYRAELRRAGNLTVYLRANALRFEVGENGEPVRQVDVGVLAHGQFAVRARSYIIATGGIESARLLLLSENRAGIGLGNDHDLVGRFFMLHLEYSGGAIVTGDQKRDLSFQTGEGGAVSRRLGINRRFVSYGSLSDDTRRRLNLPAMRLRFLYPRNPEVDAMSRLLGGTGSKADIVRDLSDIISKFPELAIYIARQLVYGRVKPSPALAAVPLKCTSEQMPNPDSRIALGDDRDAFGLRKITVDWQVSEEDRRGIVASSRLLATELHHSGFGRLHSAILERGDEWPQDLRGDEHHMGTTRMHPDPTQGVVDEHCRVHGTDNVYVASCAVFPTSGTFNPTLTILALALRLADHVKERLKNA